MSFGDWLEPLRHALSCSQREACVFFRDDDAGWSNAALMRLLDLFARYGTPVDLAVIPAALDTALAQALHSRAQDLPLGLHQHGFAHVNHERSGRKCEFGPSQCHKAHRATRVDA